MGQQDQISSTETILRRITKKPNNRQALPGGGHRATSFAIQAKPGEKGASCSRLLLTSPYGLLELVRPQGLNPDDFDVCRISVGDVRAIGLDVIFCPTADDPGHCEIRPTPTTSFSKSVWSKLAQKTRVLTAQEVDTVQAGDSLED